MEGLIKAVFAGMAAVVAVTGLVLGMSSVASAGKEVRGDEVAIKRDEEDVEAALARGDDDADDEWGPTGRLVALADGDASASRDRSGDITSGDRSWSRDRSRDRTGDGVGVNDRSYSWDRSGDRTGDHNTADASRSRDVSADNTSATGGTTASLV
ncbi:MAG TPA: hypothetical protein VHF23_01505 [Gaiellaceae bacterium]|nr:hypothetical protein [Gaiellaceae bacterium]